MRVLGVLYFIIYFFEVSLHYVAHIVLKLAVPTLASQVPKLHTCTSMPSLVYLFIYFENYFVNKHHLMPRSLENKILNP
jgi:hypothetical protein